MPTVTKRVWLRRRCVDCRGGEVRRAESAAGAIPLHLPRTAASLDAGGASRSAISDHAPLELRMSRSSPGRYSLHDFAKNVYDVHAFGVDGRELTTTRPIPTAGPSPDTAAAVTVRYKVYGDRVDGTYLAVDTTHAHINMPAAIMWARGLDDRPATLTFEPPAGTRWQVATQLHPGSTPFEFTAPNLQYLMDSPVEFGPVAMRQFSVDGRDVPLRRCITRAPTPSSTAS